MIRQMDLDLTSLDRSREPIGTNDVHELSVVSDFVRDQSRDRSDISPIVSQSQPVSPKGGKTSETGSLVPPSSSAAPQLRSQRTELGGGGPAGRQLRPYQISALQAIDAELARGVKRTLLVMATGTGKTFTFSLHARADVEAGDSVLVLAHRTELIEQARNAFRAIGIHAEIEQGATRASTTAKVVIASVQTLRGKRLERYSPTRFRKIIVDEGHHTAAQSYVNILDRFPDARVLGVTATPDRGDGKGLGDHYESIAFTYDMRTAIRDGYLAKLIARRVIVKGLDLSRIKTRAGDFAQDQLAAVLTTEKALHGVASPLVELAGNRKTIVFAVDVAHVHALAEVINRYKPGSAIGIDGGMKAEQRAAILDLFRKGTFQFLVNCEILTEGFDEPSVSCIATARPTQSRALYTQMVGRGARLLGDTYEQSVANGKADFLALDFAGNSRHALIGPADALGGSLDETTRAIVERRLAEGGDVEEIIELAEQEATAHLSKAAVTALALYRAKEIDPFVGDFLKPLDLNSPSAREPATEAQLSAIKKLKLGDPPPGFTKGEASQFLDAVIARQKAGLASVPQMRCLEKFGLDTRMPTKECPRGMTFARANELIKMAATRGWKPYTFLHEPEMRRGKRSGGSL